MVITTTESIQGFKIGDYLGIVTGIKVHKAKMNLGFSSSKFYESFEGHIVDLKEGAFQQLKENAQKLKANAVIGVNIDIEHMANSNSLVVSVTGTAVKVMVE